MRETISGPFTVAGFDIDDFGSLFLLLQNVLQ